MIAHTIFGSPGTGKTTEILRRVDGLRERGYDAQDIGFMSHTRAAAAEALQRLGLKHSNKVSTIHSLCFSMLGLTRDMVVDRERIKAFAESVGVPVRGGSVDDNDQIEVGDEYLAVHNVAVATMKPARGVFDRSGANGTWPQCEFFIDSYRAWKGKHGLLDFNDMLSSIAHAPRPTSCGARALLIDEAQDLSPLQWAVVRKLLQCPKVDEVHVAGDDDQAIYVWGGADPAGMRQFEQEYAAIRLVLPQSYRIPRVVHRLAHKIISKAPDRVPKEYAARDEEGTLAECNDLYGLRFDTPTLILARTGARKKEIERYLIAECVPYHTEGGYPGLLQNRTARALRALHALRRGESIHANEYAVLRQEALPSGRVCMIEGRPDLERLAAKPDRQVVQIPQWLFRYYDRVDVDTKPKVRLMTIHASKGREEDRVVVDTSLTRRISNGMGDDPGSEARVFYVAVTRARHRLDIVHGVNGYPL